MGSDLFWEGRQENPKLRRQMTAELVELCKNLGWAYEALSPSQTFTATIEPPTWYLERQDRLHTNSL